jgi:hypothetical protein
MNADRDFERITSAWLDLMPSEAPDRLIDAVHQAVETAPQVRRPIRRAAMRPTPMTRFALIAAAAVLGAALLGGALLVGGRPSTPAPLPQPASSDAPTADASSAPAPESLRANWLAGPVPLASVRSSESAPSGNPEGLLRLVVNASGAATWLQLPEGSERLRSTVATTGPDELTLTLVGDAGDGCQEGAVGRYGWAVDGDRTTLTLRAIEDPCALRSETYERTWTRTHTGASDGGTAVVPGVGPLFEVTLPAGAYTTRPLTDAQEIYDQARDYILYAWKNPQGFASACSLAERYRWTPGAQAFVDYIRQNDAFENVKSEATTVGGYPALHVTFDSVDSYPACPGAEWLEQLVPKNAPDGGWHIGFGESDSYYVVDHPDATVLFQVLPIDATAEGEVIPTIRFLDSLPDGR